MSYYIYGTNDPEKEPYTLCPPQLFEFDTLGQAVDTIQRWVETFFEMDYVRIIQALFPPEELGQMELDNFTVGYWRLGKVQFIKL